jgi:hypothetical protein
MNNNKSINNKNLINSKNDKSIKDKELEEIYDRLGFWYLVYQPNPSKENLRAWLDGSDYSSYYSFEEILALAPLQVKTDLKTSFNDYSVFLWDVANFKITRLSSLGDHVPIGEWIKAKKTEGYVEEEKEQAHQFWKSPLSWNPFKGVKVKTDE